MKFIKTPRLLTVVTASFAVIVTPANATVGFLNGYSGTDTEVSSATLLTYSADVSGSDLIDGMTPTVATGWNNTNQAHFNELNDGIHGVGFGVVGGDNVQGAWTNPNAVATYTLGTGTGGLGYDITSIQSIADWVNVGFGNQVWTLSVQLVGGGAFVDVATVDYQALGSGGGTTKVSLNDLDITGIQALSVTAGSQSGHGSNAFVWRELDVIGAETTGGPDATPPMVATLDPTNASPNVLAGSNFVVTFDENIAVGTGNITIKDLDTPSQNAIPVGDGQISVSGAVLTINPTSDLDPNTNYAIQIEATAIEDIAGNPFAGILNDTTWAFTTADPDLTSPSIVTLNPADDASAVSLSTDLMVTFDENIAIGTGNVTIKDLDTPSQTAIPIGDTQISVTGTVLTINPGSNLAPGTNYAIQIDATAIDDTSGNSFVGILDDTTWNFATGTPPAEEFSATLLTYAADVSASDLLHGLTPTTTGWNTANEASPLELNDGMHGVGFGEVSGDRVQGAWTTVGATAEYNLGLSPGGAGWDITSIQSIADWVNVGFGNQVWTVEVKPVGGVYTTLDTVDYQPLGNGGGTTKVTLTDPSGVLATGIEFIKITAGSQSGHGSGAFVWRELDVFGMSSNDETPPQIATLNPANGASGVVPGGNLVATFDENIVIGTGNITIKDLDTPSQTVIPVGDGQISVSGAVLTIDPTSDLAINTNYAIQIDATAIDDASGNSFLGITNDSTWAFTTGEPDTTAPTIASLSPTDGASDVALASNLVVTFDEDIATGTGNITIKDLDTPSQTVIPVGDGQISLSGAVLTINPSSNLATLTNYAIQIGSTAITDLAGNPFVGISDDTTWNFASADEPLRIMAMGDSITAGYTDNNTWSVPYWYGYRSGLYNRLDTAGYNFTFVGQSTELLDHFPAGTVPPADLNALGQNSHNGYGGWSASGLNANILTWLANDEPDIILLKIGTNSQDQTGLNTLVNTITTQRPNLHLIIAEIMPKWTYQQGIVNYNTYIRDTLVPLYQGQGKNVTVVDQYAPFLTNPADLTSIDQSLISNGINHPDNVGYDKMAQVWFEGIEALGLGSNNFTSWISDPAFGLDPADQDFGDDPDGDRLVNGLEAWFGTHPGQFNAGLTGLATDGTTATFSHSQNENPPSDLSGSYEWSPNLVDWYASDGADGPVSGPTVTAVPMTVGATTTVTATASEPLERLFLRIAVTQN